MTLLLVDPIAVTSGLLATYGFASTASWGIHLIFGPVVMRLACTLRA
jgi:hypothetical protein